MNCCRIAGGQRLRLPENPGYGECGLARRLRKAVNKPGRCDIRNTGRARKKNRDQHSDSGDRRVHRRTHSLLPVVSSKAVAIGPRRFSSALITSIDRSTSFLASAFSLMRDKKGGMVGLRLIDCMSGGFFGGFGSSTQILPIDIWAKVFAADGAGGYALDIWTALRRNSFAPF